MPIIPKVGRKSLKIRLVIASMYVILTAGAVTMVYPFLLMLSTSLTSSVDTNEYRLIPRFFTREAPLYAKFVDDRYAGDTDAVNQLYATSFKKPQDVTPPSTLDSPQTRALVRAWRDCIQGLPQRWKQGVFREFGANPGLLKEQYQAFLRAHFHNDINALNRVYVDQNETFETVAPPLERVTNRVWQPDDSPKMRDFLAWRATLPDSMVAVVSVEAIWDQWLKDERYKGDLKALQHRWQAWGPQANDWHLPLLARPETLANSFLNSAYNADWEQFVRTALPLCYVVTPNAETAHRNALRAQYKNIATLNQRYGTHYTRFEEIPLPGPLHLPDRGDLLNDWARFVEKDCPTTSLLIDTPENRFREQLFSRFHSIEAMNAAFGTHWRSTTDIFPPYALSDALYVHDNGSALRREYITRNYRQVVNYILLHGRSVGVTAFFCLAMIATNLLVNPLCAYALSRYGLPYASKILLFLLATMAFPAEVALIPNFLLLKQFGMLNTYWALILPGMASGFSIFLLKGFFDSLPREIYEAATLDGASELRMFFRLTLPLCKPIFAVIALNAFTAAYGAFMFALVVCQDSRMWTLMVWLYELQITAPQYVVMAGLTVAALPTLLVFLFAQNVILRGIILPSYK